MLIEQICARILGDQATSDAVKAAATRAFEDTIAVAFAGWHEPVAQAAQRYGKGSLVPLIDGNCAASPEHAAFIHAVAGHALDYDDVHLVSVTHPSVVIVPALMALAPYGASGRSILDAYGVGVSVNIALGRLLGFGHYARGWHATSTIGPLAAAAAGCHLLDAKENEVRSALSLAAAHSAGLQRNFGAMAKPVQAGNAASAGVRAALLAADGVTGDSDIFGAKGFLDLYNADGAAIGTLNPDDVHSVSVKLYPCCYAAHRMIKAVIDARAQIKSDRDIMEVERVDVSAPFETMGPLRVTNPKSGNEGKFCATYIVAVTLMQGHVSLSDFTDEAVHRPDVREMMTRVRLEDDSASGRSAVSLEHGRIEVRLIIGGLRGEGSCSVFPGSPEAPPSRADLEAKLTDCAEIYAAASGRSFCSGGVRRTISKFTAVERSTRPAMADAT